MPNRETPVVVLVLALVFQTASHPSERIHQSESLVFTHVGVIDVAAKDPRRALTVNRTVVVTGDRITAVGRTGTVRIPEGAQVIDAAGQFLIPGLWDMHVHIFDDNWTTASEFNLFLANGVTGIRDMGSNLARVLDLRKQIASGSMLGPRMVVAGPNIYGIAGPAASRRFISAEEAREEVRRRKQAGVDFIKLYSFLSSDAFFAAIDEATKQGLAAVGHVPFGVRASDAAKAGLRSVEHLEGVVIESADLEDSLREEIDVRIREGKPIEVRLIEVDQTERYRDSYNPTKLRQLSGQFVKYHTYQCANLNLVETLGQYLTSGFADYPYLRYVSGSRLDSWKRRLANAFSPDQIPNVSVYAAYKRVLTTAMHRAGVQFLAGTDSPVLGQVPGFGLHDELASFVQVGLTPLEALQTATINPARLFRRERDLGTIQRGKLADLVLLDANPIDDIANTRRINAVIVNGRFLGNNRLRQMLAEVEADANKP